MFFDSLLNNEEKPGMMLNFLPKGRNVYEYD